MLRNLTFEETAVWYCTADGSDPLKITVRVVPIRPLPVVSRKLVATRENEVVALDCVSVGSDPVPVLSWLVHKDLEMVNSTEIVNNGGPNTTAILKLNATADLNYTTYSCVAKFSQLPNLVQVSATTARLVISDDEDVLNGVTTTPATLATSVAATAEMKGTREEPGDQLTRYRMLQLLVGILWGLGGGLPLVLAIAIIVCCCYREKKEFTLEMDSARVSVHFGENDDDSEICGREMS